ncbi:hypothetical protein MNB_SUP05-5-542 [hydrothermal vent metagenome]|uniref:Uncharacterized protein n=1 Tax=hydrothermal vent metagenome TaxID=652676 RepID=A0A1W1C6V5_9ZZZZ
MGFKPETLRLFIGMFVSGAGILFFDFFRILVNSEIYNQLYGEMLFSITAAIVLFILAFFLLRDLSKKGG